MDEEEHSEVLFTFPNFLDYHCLFSGSTEIWQFLLVALVLGLGFHKNAGIDIDSV